MTFTPEQIRFRKLLDELEWLSYDLGFNHRPSHASKARLDKQRAVREELLKMFDAMSAAVSGSHTAEEQEIIRLGGAIDVLTQCLADIEQRKKREGT